MLKKKKKLFTEYFNSTGVFFGSAHQGRSKPLKKKILIKISYKIRLISLMEIFNLNICRLITSDNVNLMLPFCSGSLPSKIAKKKILKNI